MEKVRSVKDQEVFKLAHQLTLQVNQITCSFPNEEQFGLVAQMRRSSSSIPMNLGEGAGRINSAEYRHFVGIAKGSAAEISYQLMLAHLINDEIFDKLNEGYTDVNRMLAGLAKSLSKK